MEFRTHLSALNFLHCFFVQRALAKGIPKKVEGKPAQVWEWTMDGETVVCPEPAVLLLPASLKDEADRINAAMEGGVL